MADSLSTVCQDAGKYTGFTQDGKCFTCDAIQVMWDGFNYLWTSFVPELLPIVFGLIGTGTFFYIYYAWYKNQYGTRLTKEEIRADIRSFVVKLTFIIVTFGTRGAFISWVVGYFVFLPLGGILKAVAYAIAGIVNHYPSLGHVVAPYCTPEKYGNIGGAMACVASFNEASIGWIGQMIANSMNLGNIMTPTFWVALFLLFKVVDPILSAPSALARAAYRIGSVTAISPIIGGFWLFPSSKGAHKILAETVVYVCLLIVFSVFAVTFSSAAATVIVQSVLSYAYPNLSAGSVATSPWAPGSSFDPFNCAVALADGPLSLDPAKPTLWFVLLVMELYRAFMDEARAMASEIKDKIFR